MDSTADQLTGISADLSMVNGSPACRTKIENAGPPVVGFKMLAHKIIAEVAWPGRPCVFPDSHVGTLWRPVERESCHRIAQMSAHAVCRQLPAATGVALLWRRHAGGCRKPSAAAS
jgi:hypothetical protein